MRNTFAADVGESFAVHWTLLLSTTTKLAKHWPAAERAVDLQYNSNLILIISFRRRLCALAQKEWSEVKTSRDEFPTLSPRLLTINWTHWRKTLAWGNNQLHSFSIHSSIHPPFNCPWLITANWMLKAPSEIFFCETVFFSKEVSLSL